MNFKQENEIFRNLTMTEEINLSDFLKTVKNYDEKVLQEVVSEFKQYYGQVKEVVKIYSSYIEKVVGVIKW